MSQDDEPDLDLESSWADLGIGSPILLSAGIRASNIKGSMTLASEKAIFKLREIIGEKYSEQTLTADTLAEIVGVGVRTFVEHWYDELRSQNLAGLVEVVLEGQKLSPTQIKGFVHALPNDLVEKIARSEVHSANGYHGLMALEHHRRIKTIENYEVGLDGNRVWVEFVHSSKDGSEPALVRFYLDEKFDLDAL